MALDARVRRARLHECDDDARIAKYFFDNKMRTCERRLDVSRISE